MRFKKLEKIIIYLSMAEFSFIVQKILKRGCVESKKFNGTELFVSPRTGYWQLVD